MDKVPATLNDVNDFFGGGYSNFFTLNNITYRDFQNNFGKKILQMLTWKFLVFPQFPNSNSRPIISLHFDICGAFLISNVYQ